MKKYLITCQLLPNNEIKQILLETEIEMNADECDFEYKYENEHTDVISVFDCETCKFIIANGNEETEIE